MLPNFDALPIALSVPPTDDDASGDAVALNDALAEAPLLSLDCKDAERVALADADAHSVGAASVGVAV